MHIQSHQSVCQSNQVDEFGKGSAETDGIGLLVASMAQLRRLGARALVTTHFLEIFHEGLIPREVSDKICYRMDVFVPPAPLPPPAPAATAGTDLPPYMCICIQTWWRVGRRFLNSSSDNSNRRQRPAATAAGGHEHHPDDRPALQADQGLRLLLRRLLLRRARGARHARRAARRVSSSSSCCCCCGCWWGWWWWWELGD